MIKMAYMKKEYNHLTLRRNGWKGYTLWVEISNPPNNQITLKVIKELLLLLNEIERDKSVRVFIITSKECQENYFFDYSIQVLAKINASKKKVLKKNIKKLHHAIEKLNKISIVAINGRTNNSGTELIGHFDFRFMVAGEGFTIGQPYCMPISLLGKNIKKARIQRLMTCGYNLTPDDAKKIGLVTEIYNKNEFTKKIQDYADILSRRPPIAVAAIKRSVLQGMQTNLITALCIESLESIKCIISNDARDATREYLAFIKEKINVPVDRRASIDEVQAFLESPRFYSKFKGI